jgi:glycerol-3-phosphate O-acyltransferase
VILEQPLPDPEDTQASEPADRGDATGKGTHSKRKTIVAPLPDRTRHAGSMLERWGLLGRLLSRLFFAPVFFPAESVETVRRAAELGTVVYVLRARNTLEFLYFNYAFLARSLPLARFANGVRLAFWLPMRQLLRRIFGKGVRHDGIEIVRRLTRARRSSALFLRTPPGLMAPAGFEGPYLRTLLELQREQQRKIMLVPLTVIWGRRPVRPPKGPLGLFDPLLGDQDEPRLFRRVWQVLRHARRSLALVCEPVDLQDFIAEQPPGTDEVEALDRSLLERIEGERRVRIGPRRAHPIEIRRRVLSSAPVKEAIRRRASSSSTPVSKVRRRTLRELKRMQASMTPRGMLRGSWMVRQVWKRIFTGFEVDEAGVTRFRQRGTQGPLLFLPTHRSHIDYLLMSDLCVARGLLPPHIAAGINLSFWPVGWIFRTGGAFFIKRRIQGDDLYAALLRAYVAAIIKEGHNIEVFIEGTRSRTGRVLPPKLGLLSVLADIAATENVPPMHVVPVSIGYERVVECSSLTGELTGGKKQAESVGGVLRAARVLKQNYGYVNVQFAEPIEVRSFLAGRGYDSAETLPEVRRKAILALGYHTSSTNSEITAVTPTSLCCAALLAPGTRGVQHDALRRTLKLFGDAGRVAGARFVDSMWPDDECPLDDEAIGYAVDLLAQDGAVKVVGKGDETVYVVENQARIPLEFYKNQMVQHLLDHSLMAMVMRALYVHEGESIPRASLERASRFIASLVRLHFVHHAGETVDQLIEGALQRLLDLGMVEQLQDGDVRIIPEQQGRLALLASQLESAIEAHGAAARALLVLRGGPRSRKPLEREVLQQLHRWYLTDKLQRYESCQMPYVRIAIDWLCEEGILMLQGGGSTAEVRLARQHEDGRALSVLVERTERLLPRVVPTSS